MRTNSKFNLALISLCTLVLFFSCKKESGINVKQQTSISTNSTNTTLTNGLVGWYTFNGDDSDHSGYHNNVNFNNATPSAGKNGLPNTAYHFDGSTSYMTIPNSKTLNPKHAITLVAFVQPTAFYQGECHRNTILYKAADDNTPGKYLLAYDDMAYYNFQGCDEVVKEKFENFYGSYGDGQATAAGVRDDSTLIHAGSWYVVAFTYDGDTCKLYINGKLAETNAATTTFTPNQVPVYIGRSPDSGFPYWFTGNMDEIRIYSRALTETQIKQLTKVLQNS